MVENEQSLKKDIYCSVNKKNEKTWVSSDILPALGT